MTESGSEPPRVVVIDDDPDVALFTQRILMKRAGCVVEVLTDPLEARGIVGRFVPDVVVTDIEMPGVNGLELMAQLRRESPGLKIVVMTAHVSVEYAVSALREHADEFLTKPVDSAELVSIVSRLAAESRRVREQQREQVVLAIGAHPDDVEIGVGATLVAHRAVGDTVVVLTLSRGARGGDVDRRQHESVAAAELLGARLFLEDLWDTRIARSDEPVDIIERVVREVRPSSVYTHSSHDRHQDHRAVHEATMVATRDIPVVGCYQSPSSTVDFRPNRFVTVDDHIEGKLRLLDCYRSQSDVRGYLKPDFVLATARYWSRFGTGTSAEPLEIVRDAAGISGRLSAQGVAVTSLALLLPYLLGVEPWQGENPADVWHALFAPGVLVLAALTLNELSRRVRVQVVRLREREARQREAELFSRSPRRHHRRRQPGGSRHDLHRDAAVPRENVNPAEHPGARRRPGRGTAG
ncbi:response regulator [Microbacterium betulae]|uniref:response regulator n=1 Tax=Microbacterium betulae TaxID=2981139 RepID=UPI0029393018|nr:response regulator [Microbacterium sp. AB]